MADTEDSKSASGSGPPPSKKARITPTEARYAEAEKQVAMALDIFDYDEVVALASNALHPKPSRMNENIVKARKIILWSRCKAYDYQGLEELALEDARNALKLDPDDPVANVRIVVLLIDAQQLRLHDTCKGPTSSRASSNHRTRPTCFATLASCARRYLSALLL